VRADINVFDIENL